MKNMKAVLLGEKVTTEKMKYERIENESDTVAYGSVRTA